jgi:hypothetical protein
MSFSIITRIIRIYIIGTATRRFDPVVPVGAFVSVSANVTASES